jgi:hypothetical protein
MASIEQLAGLLFVYVLLYVVVSYFLYHRRWKSEDETDAAAPTPRARPSASTDAGPHDPADPSTVVCHACRSENGAEYTYCRNCVAELGEFGGRSSGA